MARMARRESDAGFNVKCEHWQLQEVYGASKKLIGYQCRTCKAPVGGPSYPKGDAKRKKRKIVSHVFPGFEGFMGLKDRKKAGLK